MIPKREKVTELEPKTKLWLEKDGEPIVGEGRIKLLSEIEKGGSLSQAARKLNMSYRHAWGIIKKIENRLGFKLVETSRGGESGGGTELTDRGRKLIEKYNLVKETLDEAVEKETF